jgi:hypothetical protein
MDTHTIHISVEELALVLGEIGHADSARALLGTQLPVGASRREMELCIRTAMHSLLARGLVDIDQEGVLTIAPRLARMAGTLMQASFSLRYSRFEEHAEINLTCHYCGDAIVAQHVEKEVVHSLGQLDSIEEIVERGIAFLDVAEAQPTSFEPFELPQHFLTEARDGRSAEEVAQQLHSAEVADALCPLLAEDLMAPSFRGSILRIEYEHDGTPVSDMGLLALRGAGRLWLMRPVERDGRPCFVVMPGTEDLFRQELASLLR